MKRSGNKMMQATIKHDDITFTVTFDFDKGEPATPDCPGRPDEVTVHSVKIGELEVIEILSKRVLGDIEHQIFVVMGTIAPFGAHLLGGIMKRPQNSSVQRAFPYPAEPFDSWFDRHPVISGGAVGIIMAVIMFFGLTF